MPYNFDMVKFKVQLQKFKSKGEKTGWTYIEIPAEVANKLKPDNKKTFRVKGKIDEHRIDAVALIPIGEGKFILAVNAVMRKAIKKIHGALVEIHIEEDEKQMINDELLIACLNDEPNALNYFIGLPKSHQNWFSNWVKSAKTQATLTKRIAAIVHACTLKMSFSDMMKEYKEGKNFIR